jgi:hypothetical protein
MPLDDKMRNTAIAEVLAHRQPRLTAADHQCPDFLS